MQAARGASLTPGDESAPAATFERGRALGAFAATAVLAYLADLATKWWALHSLADGDRPLVGDVLTLHLTHNPGAAFSTGTEFTVVFSTLATVAVVVVLWLSRRLGNPLWAVGLGLLLGGVSGNLTDRLVREPGPMRGHVVDFLMLPHWPVFNVADVCINVAAGLIVLQTLRGVQLDGGRAHREEQ